MTPDPVSLDLSRVAAGELPTLVLAASDLDHALTLTVAIERARRGLCWSVAVTGNPALASRLRLGLAGFMQVQHVVSLALDRAAGRDPPRGPGTVVLADVGEVAVGVGLAGGVVWGVVLVGTETLRLPASGLRQLRTALAVAESRMARAMGERVQ